MEPDPSDGSRETETDIDLLLEMLKKYGKSDLTNISIKLGVSPTIVESWVRILESGRLVRVTHELGKMYIRLIPNDSAEKE